MNLLTHISNKMQKCKDYCKQNEGAFKRAWKIVKHFKYEFLVVCEVISLLCGFLNSRRNKTDSNLFSSVSTLFGALIALNVAKDVKMHNEKKYSDIISVVKDKNDD